MANLEETIRDYVKSGARYLMVGNAAAALAALNVVNEHPEAKTPFALFGAGLIGAVLFYTFYVGYLIELHLGTASNPAGRALLSWLSAVSGIAAVAGFVFGIGVAIMGVLSV